MKNVRAMITISIQEAEARLSDLIRQLRPGEEVVITENDKPVAKLTGEAARAQSGMRPPPGLGKGYLTIVSDDDEHLKDFVRLKRFLTSII